MENEPLCKMLPQEEVRKEGSALGTRVEFLQSFSKERSAEVQLVLVVVAQKGLLRGGKCCSFGLAAFGWAIPVLGKTREAKLGG